MPNGGIKRRETLNHRRVRRSRSGFHAVFYALCKASNTRFSLDLIRAYEEDPVKGLAVRFDPSRYECLEEFRRDYLCHSYLRKFEGLSTGINLEAAATNLFNEAEQSCRLTNKRLLNYENLGYRVTSQVERARAAIKRVIGDRPPSDWYDSSDWGPGATFDVTGDRVNLLEKIQSKLTVTVGARRHLLRALSEDVHLSAARGLTNPFATGEFIPTGDYSVLTTEIEVVPGNRHTTVPKDSKTNRNICIEPTGNIFLQKGVGAVIRRRLYSRAGIDLNDQTINQVLAKSALANGYATLDLSNASDSVSYELVKLLLPDAWFRLLADLRCGATLKSGDWVLNEKFSSMGNGFTFELESLIFYALGIAAGCEVLSVYGDDLICNASAAESYIGLLEAMGFKLNTDKSYVSGLFYESCGKHYFKGMDVTPIYQKEDFHENKTWKLASESLWYRSCNRICRYSASLYGCRPDGPTAPYHLRAAYQAALRLRWGRASRPPLLIPDGIGDGGLLSDFDLSDPDKILSLRCIIPVNVGRTDDNSRYATALRRSVVRRNSDVKYRSLREWLDKRLGVSDPIVEAFNTRGRDTLRVAKLSFPVWQLT